MKWMPQLSQEKQVNLDRLMAKKPYYTQTGYRSENSKDKTGIVKWQVQYQENKTGQFRVKGGTKAPNGSVDTQLPFFLFPFMKDAENLEPEKMLGKIWFSKSLKSATQWG